MGGARPGAAGGAAVGGAKLAPAARPAAPAPAAKPAAGSPAARPAAPAPAAKPAAGSPAAGPAAKPAAAAAPAAPKKPSLASQTAELRQMRAASQARQGAMLNQSFDLFDVIKGHLLDEGYADNEDAALAIMANMSEEWKQNIVEQMTVNAADVRGGTQAAKNAAAGMKDKSGNPMYKPGVGVGPDFKLVKGV